MLFADIKNTNFLYISNSIADINDELLVSLIQLLTSVIQLPCTAVTRTHVHIHTMVASTWLGDFQGIPSAPTNSLHELHMTRYQVIIVITNHHPRTSRPVRLQLDFEIALLLRPGASNIPLRRIFPPSQPLPPPPSLSLPIPPLPSHFPSLYATFGCTLSTNKVILFIIIIIIIAIGPTCGEH